MYLKIQLMNATMVLIQYLFISLSLNVFKTYTSINIDENVSAYT